MNGSKNVRLQKSDYIVFQLSIDEAMTNYHDNNFPMQAVARQLSRLSVLQRPRVGATLLTDVGSNTGQSISW